MSSDGRVRSGVMWCCGGWAVSSHVLCCVAGLGYSMVLMRQVAVQPSRVPFYPV